MDIGTGIAIAGVWLLPVAAFMSAWVSNFGKYLALIIAIVLTIYLR
jgi:hypothetical protein